MDRPVALGDRAGVRALVVARLREADRERPDGVAALLGHRRDDDARVDAAGQERAERHVRDEPLADRREDPVADGLEPLLVAPLLAASPRAASSGRRVAVPFSTVSVQPGGSRLIPRSAVRSPGHVAEGEVRIEALELDLPRARPGTSSSAFSSEAKATVPSSSCVQRSGFLPNRSRARTRRCRVASQTASANMPSRCSTNASPCCS